MDIIYLKIKIRKSDKMAEAFRNQGLFFDCIAESLDINREQIEEIDDSNLTKSIKALANQWS